jgi:hypothetical protein
LEDELHLLLEGAILDARRHHRRRGRAAGGQGYAGERDRATGQPAKGSALEIPPILRPWLVRVVSSARSARLDRYAGPQ